MSGFRPKKEVSSEMPPAAAPSQVHDTRETSSVVKPIAAMARKTALLAALAFTAGWAFGVRLHPDVLKPAPTAVQADTVLELNSGQSITGRLVSERADGVTFLMEGSEVPFSKGEIKKLRPATAAEAALEATANSVKRPFVTIRREDTFQYKLKNNKKLF